MTSGRSTSPLLPLAPVAFALLVFYPITRNYFFGDDLVNLYRVVNQNLFQFLITPYGDHMLFLRNLIFALCYHLFGTHAELYFWLVLPTHLLNVYLLFRLIRLLTDSGRLACFGAALWGAAPVHVGTLGWYSVYGQVLAVTLVLVVLVGLARAARGLPLTRARLAAWVVLCLGAATSFGVGVGLVLVLPAVAWLLLPPSSQRRRAVGGLALGVAGVVLLYFALPRLAVHLYDVRVKFPSGALGYWQTKLALALHLAANGLTDLTARQLYDPRNYPDALTISIVGAGLALLAASLWLAPTAVRRRILAFLLLAGGSYGIIAAGRGAMYARTARKALVIASRYQYAGALGIAVALCVILAWIVTRRPLPDAVKNGVLILWFGLAVAAHFTLGDPIDHHDRERRIMQYVVASIRQRIAAAPAGADVYIDLPEHPFAGVGPLLRRREDYFPSWAGVFTVFFPSNVVGGRRVFFVTSKHRVLAAARSGKRSRTLLISPSERSLREE